MRRAFVDALRLCLAAGLAALATTTGSVAAAVFATGAAPAWAAATTISATGPSACAPGPFSPSRGFRVALFASGFPTDQPPPTAPVGPGPTAPVAPACAGAEAPAFSPRDQAYVGDFYTGTIYVLSRSGGVAADATQLPDAHFGAFDLASLSFGWGGVLYASLWGPGQRAAQPELVELDPVTGAEVRIIARAADGLAGCPGRAVADPLDGYLFVPGNCYRGAFSGGAIDRISSPGSANPDVSTFARVPEPVSGLTFASDGALYAETGPGTGPTSGSGPSSGSARVVRVAGPGTVLISPPTLVGDISGGLGGGVAVSAGARRGHASALEAPNREDDIYTFPLSHLPAVPHRDVRSSPAPGAGPKAGFGWGVTWHRGCLYFADGAVIERACGSSPGNLTTIASSLPSPSRAFRPFASDAIDALIAAAVALLVSFAAGTVNDALADGYGDIFVRWARWSRGPGKCLLTRPGKRPLTGPGKRWAGPVAVVLAGSVVGSLLSPDWGLNSWTLICFLAIAAAILAGAALPAVFKGPYLRSRGHRPVAPRLKALPAGLLVAALCVIFSRATGFHPGYLYGAVVGIGFGPVLAEAEEGRAVAVASTAQLLAGLVAWAAWDGLFQTSSLPGAFFGAVFATDFFAALFVSSVVGTVVSLLPLRHLAGYELKSWDARAWAALFGAAVFVLVQLVLRPISRPGGRSDLPLMATLSLLVLFCAGSVLLRDRLSRQQHRKQRAGPVPASQQEASGPPDSVLVSGARD